MTNIIAAAEFKAKCLSIFQNVQDSGNEYIITKHNKQVAKIVPISPPLAPENIFGMFAAIGEIKEDIISSIEETWDVQTTQAEFISNNDPKQSH
jgi:prevent-host-death family protein